MNFNTRLLHGDAVKKYSSGATLPPIVQVNAFQYDSAEEIEKVFHHKAAGYAYSRVANPSIAAFEQRINEIEKGNAAIACSSGMTAIALSILNFLCSGDEIIASGGLYGGSFDLFEDLTKFGIITKYVKHMTPDEIKPLIGKNTRVIFGEVLSNPGLEIMNVQEIANFAHENDLPLIVDATTVTPFLINPISLGADVVIHSTTKYINGSGDAIGGVIIDGANFKWDFDKFRGLNGYKKFGKAAYTVRLRTDILENTGGCMSPMNAFLNIIGLETLGLRMKCICNNAKILAEALNEIPELKVNYPILENNKYKNLASEQLNGMGGGILTFRAGSKDKAYKIINNLKYAVRATSIGDTRTLVIHPESTLYIRNTKEQRETAGVFEDTVRVSVGIEDADDLIHDFINAIKGA